MCHGTPPVFVWIILLGYYVVLYSSVDSLERNLSIPYQALTTNLPGVRTLAEHASFFRAVIVWFHSLYLHAIAYNNICAHNTWLYHLLARCFRWHWHGPIERRYPCMVCWQRLPYSTFDRINLLVNLKNIPELYSQISGMVGKGSFYFYLN